MNVTTERLYDSATALSTSERDNEEVIIRDVVSTCARGNVPLQSRCYLTEWDKNVLRDQVLCYRIKAPIY